MGELINGCDTVENPCAEMPADPRDPRDHPVTVAAVRSELSLDRPVMIIAPDDDYAEQARTAFADRGIPTAICDSLGAAIEISRTGVVAIVTTAIVGRDMAADVRSTMQGLHVLGMALDPMRNPIRNADFEEGTRGWMTVFDESTDLGPDGYKAAMDLGGLIGDRPGMGKTRMTGDAMESLFGDEAMARERRRRSTYVLSDERSMMRELSRVAVAGMLPERGFDYAAINQRHTMRNGTRDKPTRGRYR